MPRLFVLILRTLGAAITGGVDDVGDPAIVEMRYQGEQQCTAEIISPHVALTAGHCVTDVKAGDVVTLFTGPDDAHMDNGAVLAVREMHAHPQFDPNVDRFDIAVLILAEPTTIPPLAYRRGPLDATMKGQPLRLVGYGDNTVVDPTSGAGKKRQATAPLIGFDADALTVGMPKATQCYGDSGGPALLMIEGVETIVGVDSTQDHDNCDGINHDTRVDAYADFIAMYVAADGDGTGSGSGSGSDDDSSDDDKGGCDAGSSGTASWLVLALLAIRRRR
jgi:uncharacterized protein (TIGR03382 family)